MGFVWSIELIAASVAASCCASNLDNFRTIIKYLD